MYRGSEADKKQQRAWRERNRESVSRKAAEWRRNNPDKVKEAKRKDYFKRREGILAQQKTYRDSLPKTQRLPRACLNPKCGEMFTPRAEHNVYCSSRCSNRYRYLINPDSWKKTRKRYEARHPERHRAYRNHKKAVRRARIKLNGSDTKACRKLYLLERKKAYHTCYYCQAKFKGLFHIDHVEPLCKNGAHSPHNLCVSCPRCNQKKSSNSVTELPWLNQALFPI